MDDTVTHALMITALYAPCPRNSSEQPLKLILILILIVLFGTEKQK